MHHQVFTIAFFCKYRTPFYLQILLTIAPYILFCTAPRPRLFGAREIIEHLFDTYGPGANSIPSTLLASNNPSTGTALYIYVDKYHIAVIMSVIY